MATYQLVVRVELERLDDNNGAMAWRGSAAHTFVGTLPELATATSSITITPILAKQLIDREIERNAG